MERLTCSGTKEAKPDVTIKQMIDRLAKYEDAHERIEKRIEEIKSVSYYPHNFTGQMVEDLEWVLGLLNCPDGHKN